MFRCTGASAADIARALAAAKAVFDAAGVHPYACAYAADLQEGDDPELSLSEEQCDWAELWRMAAHAALEAACPNRGVEPVGFEWSLSNVWPASSRHRA